MGNVVYYGIDAEKDVLFPYSNRILRDNPTWKQLKQRKRVQKEFHVTLAHVNSSKGSRGVQKKWKDLARLFSKNYHEAYASAGRCYDSIFADICVDHILIFEKRLVALAVSVPKLYQIKDNGQKFAHEKTPYTNAYLHITIGTMNARIAPKIVNDYLTDLYEYGDVSDGEYEISGVDTEVISSNFRLRNQQGFIFFS